MSVDPFTGSAVAVVCSVIIEPLGARSGTFCTGGGCDRQADKHGKAGGGR